MRRGGLRLIRFWLFGKYSLHVCGGNQFEDFFQDNVEVKAGAVDLGVIKWTAITHGKTLWQIGMPDRSTQEFKDGLNYRHFTNLTRYPVSFPNDVTFTIGKSKEAEDWNFAQYQVYVKQPYWSVMFDSAGQQTGKATLTLAFAAYQSAILNVSLNGTGAGCGGESGAVSEIGDGGVLPVGGAGFVKADGGADV